MDTSPLDALLAALPDELPSACGPTVLHRVRESLPMLTLAWAEDGRVRGLDDPVWQGWLDEWTTDTQGRRLSAPSLRRYRKQLLALADRWVEAGLLPRRPTLNLPSQYTRRQTVRLKHLGAFAQGLQKRLLPGGLVFGCADQDKETRLQPQRIRVKQNRLFANHPKAAQLADSIPYRGLG